MSLFDATGRGGVPRGLGKLLALNWPLVLLLTAVACAGFLMLFSVAGGSLDALGRAADGPLRRRPRRHGRRSP